MKNILKHLGYASMLVLLLASCKKDENKDYYEGGTAPTLTASSTGSIPLGFATASQRAVLLSWTNPNYMFTTGVSSHDVSYLVEIDTTGANFTNPNKKVVAVSNDLSLDITQTQLNDYLLNQLQLTPGVPHNVEIRVKSTLENNSAPLASNVLKFTVTPYTIPPKVDPPTNGTLWATGDAFASSWANPLLSPYDVSQKFTAISPTVYQLTVDMPGGGGYKLIQTQGDWNTQYHMVTGTWEGGDFEKKNSDPQFPGPPGPGRYKITVDFQRGKYSVIKL